MFQWFNNVNTETKKLFNKYLESLYKNLTYIKQNIKVIKKLLFLIIIITPSLTLIMLYKVYYPSYTLAFIILKILPVFFE